MLTKVIPDSGNVPRLAGFRRGPRKVIPPGLKILGVENQIQSIFGFGGVGGPYWECGTIPAQSWSKIFCSKIRISRRFEIRRGPREIYLSPCTPDRHVFPECSKIIKFRLCYPRAHQDFRESISLPTPNSSVDSRTTRGTFTPLSRSTKMRLFTCIFDVQSYMRE